ncbi:branched-chain amino acid ABC transporter permease [Bradyrhizobium cenepequi]
MTRLIVLIAAACVAGLAAAPVLVGPYWLGVLLQLLSWIALTQSWVLFSGLSGYVSLAHAVFYGLGAYVMALLWQELPIWQVLPLAGGLAVALAIVIGYPALRVRGPYFVILTLGLSEFVKYVVVAVEAGIGSTGRLILGAPDPEVLYYILLALAVLATALTIWLSGSRWGVGLRSIREDETAAATAGVPVTALKTAIFALSAFIPGVVGAIWVMRTTYFEPLELFSPAVSFSVVTMAIVGGSDEAAGPILGAAFIVILSELLWARAPQIYLILLGLLLICFVLFLPKGLYGHLKAHFAGRSQ